MITITHTHAEGTLLSGTARGDGTAEILKRVDPRTLSSPWRWSRNLGSWYVRQSRDKQANTWLIERTKRALQDAGFEVTVTVDDTFRCTEEVERDKADRQLDRVAALESKADRKAADAAAAWEAHDRACEALPPGGEPIHVGHHSERRHRKAIDRAWELTGKAVEAGKEAERVADRADSAAKTTAHRYSPVTVKNRIDKLEAEQRADQRALDGYRRVVARTATHEYVNEFDGATGHYRDRIVARMAQRADQITYWKDVYAQLQADGVANSYGPDTIAKGDRVKRFGAWWEVVRVNPKSVSVRELDGSGWTSTIPYHKIQGHRPAEEAS